MPFSLCRSVSVCAQICVCTSPCRPCLVFLTISNFDCHRPHCLWLHCILIISSFIKTKTEVSSLCIFIQRVTGWPRTSRHCLTIHNKKRANKPIRYDFVYLKSKSHWAWYYTETVLQVHISVRTRSNKKRKCNIAQQNFLVFISYYSPEGKEVRREMTMTSVVVVASVFNRYKDNVRWIRWLC